MSEDPVWSRPLDPARRWVGPGATDRRGRRAVSGQGICGHSMTGIGGGSFVCTLFAGHPGWHADAEGTSWSERFAGSENDALRSRLAAAEAALGEVRRLCDAVLSELDRGALNHGDDWLRMDFKVIRRTATLPTERDEPGPEDYTAPRMPKSSRVVGRIRLDDTASDEGLREALAALYAKVRAALSTDTDQGGEQ